MVKTAIFLSGKGSNALNVLKKVAQKKSPIKVVCLLTNKENSGAEAIANEFQLPYVVFSKDDFYENDKVLKSLQLLEIDLIILAGFLWLIPEKLIQEFPDRIINIHPSLLPKYGGKGMYGMNVHRAVIAHQEKETGITIHLVNKEYDKGEILFQKETIITEEDTAESVANKVHQLEYEFFPIVIEKYAKQLA